MEKTALRIEEQKPRNIRRADIAPAGGFALVVDGHSKHSSKATPLHRTPQKNCL